MNRQEKTYFEALTKHRAKLAQALEDPALRGVRNSVVEKYSDQAHFIYELLQNADDALATEARFVLESDKLIFAHNGKRRFSISNPANEDEDSIQKALGDINAITSIANSNKTKGASIGKFGVGFKAVFQYTSTPHIFDPNFRFKIERFIVPIELEEDFPGRKEDETLFVFPFDHKERGTKEAYRDISDKLRNLSYPLLFLSNLKSIEFKYDNTIGSYSKKNIESIEIEETNAEHLLLTRKSGDDLFNEELWLFSRLHDRGKEYEVDERYLSYCVGFFVDENGHLIPVNKPAFCYFPTKEVTNLNFIIHAPFLLTDSREGIRAGVDHNDEMIIVLSELAADAIVYLKDIGIKKQTRLIDDRIVSIIPVDPSVFSNPDDKSKVSFLPFYEEILHKFNTECLLPSIDGYTKRKNAYWASVPQLPILFSNEQLAELVENDNAKWVFASLARDEVQRNNKELFSFIDSLVRTNINEDIVINGRTKDFYVRDGVRQNLENIKGISAQFIENQSIDWLHSFYRWISETKHRREISLNKPIFIDKDGKACPAYDDNGQHVLFLPVPNISGYKVIHPELLENDDSKTFIYQIGIKQPSLKDQIYNIILPQYEDDDADIDTDPHFSLFFEYFCKCTNDEVDGFIGLISKIAFLAYLNPFDGEYHRCCANALYFPTDELKQYFGPIKNVFFIDIDRYKEIVGAANEDKLKNFLMRLGIKDDVKLYDVVIDSPANRADLPRPHSTRGLSYDETIIDGCKAVVKYIEKNKDTTASIALWETLIRIIENNANKVNYKGLETLLCGRCHYFYYSSLIDYFWSSDAILLKNASWIMNQEDDLVSASDLTIESLSDVYDTTSDAAQNLISFLGIESEESEDDDSNLTDEQRELIDLAKMLKRYGIENEEDLKEYQRYKMQKDAASGTDDEESKEHTGSERQQGSEQDNNSESQNDNKEDKPNDTDFTDRNGKALSKTKRDVLNDIARRTSSDLIDQDSDIHDDEDETDSDEYMPTSVDYNKKIERAKEKSAAEIEKITNWEQLNSVVQEENKTNKYSFRWFNTLLEMESIMSEGTDSHSRKVSISFAKVEREPNTKRTLVLKHPDKYIPHFMEDLADISLVLHFGDQTRSVAIDVANIQSYTLRVKLKNADSINGIDLKAITGATIDAQSPAFLLDELRKQFSELNLDDDFNLQENLTENIEFVFGPPGTGKTTHLANNVLIPLMKEQNACRILVLTPTNKSADVLVRRIMEEYGEDTSYFDWLVRFGTTSDEEIEQRSIYRDKSFDICSLRKSVTVTTIARFPYDYFMPQGKRLFLNAMNWDYIVIDEASMIPIADIVLPLYKKTPQKFIIAGDPFQIEPITAVDIWKNENIYTMVHLDSFEMPNTVPHQYKVELLTTQYRSIPDIGNIFSKFAYGGILKHNRVSESQRQLNVGNDLGIETLNIIKYPVSKYESIYRCKRLQHSSSYQVYSALFVFEYVNYLAKAIACNNPNEFYKIGVIAPYRAQADMIDKLMASEDLPKEVDIQVGTIHGFQGDECDIIFAVFNTPPTISDSKEMFLNKMNIINVSISRAKDYLFVVMPDDNTENVSRLGLIKRVESLIKETDAWQEFESPDLEELMFGDSNYLENNAFSTSHQSVNVYGLPEKCYEVRTEETAVDVQIHKERKMLSTAQDNIDPDERANQEDQTEAVKDYNGSYDLDENLVPEDLRENAIDLPVRGALEGWFYLVPYTGKLKHHTDKTTEPMFIPVMKNGRVITIPVSVVKDDRVIYIYEPMFKANEVELGKTKGIRIRTTSD